MIPVKACEGCNKGAALLSTGFHQMGKGRSLKCAHIKHACEQMEITSFQAFHYRDAAIGATGENEPIHHIGSGPRHIWLVVLDYKER